MKFCQPHWDALREAIELRGLGHLIAANGREAAARTVADLTGDDDLANYDPLMDVHWMIASRAMCVFGIAALAAGCPVCELLRALPSPPDGFRYATNEQYLIDGPADAVQQYCIEHGIARPLGSRDL